MRAAHWVYEFDETGQGTVAGQWDLPHSIAALRDDPYRSLAWSVRERAGYAKTAVPFAEFARADFFRHRIQFDNTAASCAQAVTTAVTLAHSDAAHNLPGFVAPAVAP